MIFKLTPGRGMHGRRLTSSPYPIHGCETEQAGRDSRSRTHNHHHTYQTPVPHRYLPDVIVDHLDPPGSVDLTGFSDGII